MKFPLFLDNFEDNFLLAISNLMFVTPLPQTVSRTSDALMLYPTLRRVPLSQLFIEIDS